MTLRALLDRLDVGEHYAEVLAAALGDLTLGLHLERRLEQLAADQKATAAVVATLRLGERVTTVLQGDAVSGWPN